MGNWDWVRGDRDYIRRQYREITPLSWALRALAVGFFLSGLFNNDLEWPFWVGLAIVALTIPLDWRFKRSPRDP